MQITGSLHNDGIDPWDLVLCTKAVGNEDTSPHYPKPSKYSYLDKLLLNEIEDVLGREKLPYHKGPAISIDGPYQFTIKEARLLRRENLITSDMEASAIFSVAKFRKISAASLLFTSDLATKNLE